MPEFHDLAEVKLNNNGKAWGNLGYWKHSSVYSQACQALAELLGEVLQLDETSIVMDVGFGCGDQLLLWKQQYQVAEIRGINFSGIQTQMARRRLSKAGYPNEAKALIDGDVNNPENWNFPDSDPFANRVVALDCAYHFPNKTRFFKLASQHLSSRGYIGLTDLILSNHNEGRTIRHGILLMMLKLSHIPASNLVIEHSYVEKLQQSGFGQIKIEDISANVLPGFSGWWDRYKKSGYAGTLSLSGRLKYEITARFLRWAYQKDILRYCLITATKV